MDLNNSFLSGNDNYPKTIDEALSLMMHYQDGKGKVKNETMISRDEEIPASGNATSFAQVAEKRTCFKCGKKGHIKANCPLNNNNQSSNYQNITVDGDDSISIWSQSQMSNRGNM